MSLLPTNPVKVNRLFLWGSFAAVLATFAVIAIFGFFSSGGYQEEPVSILTLIPILLVLGLAISPPYIFCSSLIKTPLGSLIASVVLFVFTLWLFAQAYFFDNHSTSGLWIFLGPLLYGIPLAIFFVLIDWLISKTGRD